MSALITAAVIGIAGTAVASNQKKVAANKANDAAQAALDAQQKLDPTKISNDAYAADLAKYQQQFQALNQVDPVTGQIRTAANAGLLASASGNDQNSTNANSILQGLFNSNNTLNPSDAAFEADLKSTAQKQLDLGGQLSPDAQAEFVRAGLENSAQSGFNGGSAATQQGVGKLLFTESNALEQQRQNMAKELFGFATDLNTTRNQNLLGIASASASKSAQDYQKLFALAQLSDSRVPNLGLSGTNIANLDVANVNQANQLATQQGAITGNNAIAQGNITAGLIGGITSGVTGIVGGLGGGIGSLFAPSQTPIAGAGLTTSPGNSGLASGIVCWVAREVYGADNPEWLQFRDAMFAKMPASFVEFYRDHGPEIAQRISGDPELKTFIRGLMDQIKLPAAA